jgi:hypothetical protein
LNPLNIDIVGLDAVIIDDLGFCVGRAVGRRVGRRVGLRVEVVSFFDDFDFEFFTLRSSDMVGYLSSLLCSPLDATLTRTYADIRSKKYRKRAVHFAMMEFEKALISKDQR